MTKSKSILVFLIATTVIASTSGCQHDPEKQMSLNSVQKAQARIEAFKDRYPTHIWTDQAAGKVSEEQEKIDDAVNYLSHARTLVKAEERLEADSFRSRAEFSLQSVSLVEAERLLVCEKKAALIEQGGATFVGYRYVSRPGITEDVAARWCGKRNDRSTWNGSTKSVRL